VSLRSCDVAVVGAGAAGLRAAIAAARAGASTTVVDGYRRPGGQYYRQRGTVDRAETMTQREGRMLIDRALRAGVTIAAGTTVWGAGGHQLELAAQKRLTTLRYQALVVATGATEVVAPFPGWTLPGVFTTGALQTLLTEHGIVPGRRVVLAGAGPLQLVVAAALVNAGIEIAGVFEAARPSRFAVRHPATVVGGLRRHGDRLVEGLNSAALLMRHRVPVRRGWGITEAIGTSEVNGARIARLDHTWEPIPGTDLVLKCDTIAVHHGLIPSNDLLHLVGAGFEYRPALGGWVPIRDESMATTVRGVYAAGDCAGIGGAAMSGVEGEIAGIAAAAYVRGSSFTPGRELTAGLAAERRFRDMYGAIFRARPGLWTMATERTIVCRCEDVPRSAVSQAIDRGATTTATVKSLTRCGMGPCQGRVCWPLIAAVVESTTGMVQAPFTRRLPLIPVPIGRLCRVDE